MYWDRAIVNAYYLFIYSFNALLLIERAHKETIQILPMRGRQYYCILIMIIQIWSWIWYRYVPTFVLFENSFWSFHKVSCVVLYLARVNFWQRNIYSTLFNFLITKAYRKISDTFNPINYRSLNRVLFETALGNQDEITG